MTASYFDVSKQQKISLAISILASESNKWEKCFFGIVSSWP